jgi:hypothetical protein
MCYHIAMLSSIAGAEVCTGFGAKGSMAIREHKDDDGSTAGMTAATVASFAQDLTTNPVYDCGRSHRYVRRSWSRLL